MSTFSSSIELGIFSGRHSISSFISESDFKAVFTTHGSTNQPNTTVQIYKMVTSLSNSLLTGKPFCYSEKCRSIKPTGPWLPLPFLAGTPIVVN